MWNTAPQIWRNSSWCPHLTFITVSCLLYVQYKYGYSSWDNITSMHVVDACYFYLPYRYVHIYPTNRQGTGVCSGWHGSLYRHPPNKRKQTEHKRIDLMEENQFNEGKFLHIMKPLEKACSTQMGAILHQMSWTEAGVRWIKRKAISRCTRLIPFFFKGGAGLISHNCNTFGSEGVNQDQEYGKFSLWRQQKKKKLQENEIIHIISHSLIREKSHSEETGNETRKQVPELFLSLNLYFCSSKIQSPPPSGYDVFMNVCDVFSNTQSYNAGIMSDTVKHS